ncbi:hypothetical protein VVAX_05932 [Variovorax paradoxus]|uniref:Uncharacterized protein n=1 Tax=Variovorax paradoxus TaxID=34073 RepID=A0A679JL12_VARPD|nr:hypothetical protein VVAX_05932 [Variovorax paradoxus]
MCSYRRMAPTARSPPASRQHAERKHCAYPLVGESRLEEASARSCARNLWPFTSYPERALSPSQMRGGPVSRDEAFESPLHRKLARHTASPMIARTSESSCPGAGTFWRAGSQPSVSTGFVRSGMQAVCRLSGSVRCHRHRHAIRTVQDDHAIDRRGHAGVFARSERGPVIGHESLHCVQPPVRRRGDSDRGIRVRTTRLSPAPGCRGSEPAMNGVGTVPFPADRARRD